MNKHPGDNPADRELDDYESQKLRRNYSAEHKNEGKSERVIPSDPAGHLDNLREFAHQAGNQDPALGHLRVGPRKSR